MSQRSPQNAFLSLLARIRPNLEQRLTESFDSVLRRAGTLGPDIAAIVEAPRELTLRGGKRFRAGLIAAGYLAADEGAPLGPAIEAGVAFELLQTYLLVQDDWMDGDATRRGGPSVHARLARTLGGDHLGACSAILASDLTWGLAVQILTYLELPAERRMEALRLFLRIHEDVVLGQQLDVLGKADDVEVMHDLKTGSYTLRGPLHMGAALAGGSFALIEGLTRFAAPLGVAFQLRDDLLGAFGDTAETGKPVGKDLVAGKRTALVAEAMQRASAQERAALLRVHGRAEMETDTEAIAAATRALVTSGARRAVEERQNALCDKAAGIATELDVRASAHEVLAGVVAALRVPLASEGAS